MGASSGKPGWLRAVRAYLMFAACHVTFKLWRKYREWRRFLESTAHLPGGVPDIFARKIRANRLRMLEFILEEVGPHGGAPLVRRSSPERILICNTPESVRFILKDEFANVTKPAKDAIIFQLLEEFLGRGIFVVRHGTGASKVENDTWTAQRKTASLIFTRGNFLSGMSETFAAKANLLVKVLEPIAASNADGATPPKSIDLQEKFFSFTFDSIQKIFFGREVNSVLGETDPYAQAFDTAHESMVRYLFGSLGMQLIQRFLLPWPLGDLSENRSGSGILIKLLRSFNPEYQSFSKNVKFLATETRRMVAELRRDPNIENRKDMMSNFIKTGRFSDQELADMMLSFVIAGRDTTACTLSWLFYELSINPEVQEKLARELKALHGGRDPTLEDLSHENLPYLNGVVFETLRLHCPVPIDVKEASSELTFPCGTQVAKGTKLAFSPYVMGRDAKRYPEPLAFRPERWIPFVNPDPYEFPVFQAGPRVCLGRDFSIFETKMLTSILVQRFHFRLQAGEQDKITSTLSLTMAIANSADKKSKHLWIVPTPRC